MNVRMIAEALERSVKTLIEKDEKQLVGLQPDGTYYYDGTNNVPVNISEKVKKIIIKDDVTEIGDKAFIHCGNLTSITIPNGVTEIGNDAFAFCRSLPSITIPNSVTRIGESAFQGCYSLESVIIPNSVTEISSSAFSNCENLKSITIPNSVIKIGSEAFANCMNLTDITIPNSVIKISKYVFKGCTNLKDIYYTGTEEEFNRTNLIYIPRNIRVHYNKITDKVSGTRQPQKGSLVKEQIRFKLKSTGNVEYIITNTIDSNKDRKEREFEYCELTSDGEFENPQYMTFADFIAKRKTGEVTIISESVNLRDNLRRRNKMKLIKEAIDDTKLRTLVKKACDYMMDEYDYAITNSAQDFGSKYKDYDVDWCEWDGQSDLAREEEEARIAAVKAAVTSLFAYYPECEHVKALIDAYDIMKGKFSI